MWGCKGNLTQELGPEDLLWLVAHYMSSAEAGAVPLWPALEKIYARWKEACGRWKIPFQPKLSVRVPGPLPWGRFWKEMILLAAKPAVLGLASAECLPPGGGVQHTLMCAADFGAALYKSLFFELLMQLCAAKLSSCLPACGTSLRCFISLPPEQLWKACSLFCYAVGDVSLMKRAALGLQPCSWWQQAGESTEMGLATVKSSFFPFNPGRSEREKRCVFALSHKKELRW